MSPQVVMALKAYRSRVLRLQVAQRFGMQPRVVGIRVAMRAALHVLGAVTRKDLVEPLDRAMQGELGLVGCRQHPCSAVDVSAQSCRCDPAAARAGHAAWRAKRELDRAIADLDPAIRLDPKYAPAYYNRGLCWEEKRDLERALADYKTFTALAPSYPVGAQAVARVTNALNRK